MVGLLLKLSNKPRLPSHRNGRRHNDDEVLAVWPIQIGRHNFLIRNLWRFLMRIS